jgi:hypothetical protein
MSKDEAVKLAAQLNAEAYEAHDTWTYEVFPSPRIGLFAVAVFSEDEWGKTCLEGLL